MLVLTFVCLLIVWISSEVQGNDSNTTWTGTCKYCSDVNPLVYLFNFIEMYSYFKKVWWIGKGECSITKSSKDIAWDVNVLATSFHFVLLLNNYKLWLQFLCCLLCWKLTDWTNVCTILHSPRTWLWLYDLDLSNILEICW